MSGEPLSVLISVVLMEGAVGGGEAVLRPSLSGGCGRSQRFFVKQLCVFWGRTARGHVMAALYAVVRFAVFARAAEQNNVARAGYDGGGHGNH